MLVLPDEVPDACLTRSELGLELDDLTLGVHQGFFDRYRLALGVGSESPLRLELGAKNRQLFQILRVNGSRRKRLVLVVLKLLEFALQRFAPGLRAARALLERLVDSFGLVRLACRFEIGLEFCNPIFRELELSLRFVSIEKGIFEFALRCRREQIRGRVRRRRDLVQPRLQLVDGRFAAGQLLFEVGDAGSQIVQLGEVSCVKSRQFRRFRLGVHYRDGCKRILFGDCGDKLFFDGVVFRAGRL